MKNILTLFLLGFVVLATAQGDKSPDFEEVMKRSKAIFTLPKNFKKTEIESFRKIPHQLAIQSNDNKNQNSDIRNQKATLHAYKSKNRFFTYHTLAEQNLFL